MPGSKAFCLTSKEGGSQTHIAVARSTPAGVYPPPPGSPTSHLRLQQRMVQESPTSPHPILGGRIVSDAAEGS